MKLNFIVTRLQAAILEEQDKIDNLYPSLTDDTKFWCMVDLVNSSNYRLLKGPRLGYVRGETFFNLVKKVIYKNNQVRLVKEIGDAVLLAADSIRPLLESCILMNKIALNIKNTQSTETYPFEIRIGFGFGIVKKLIRQYEDFLGSSIDQLARIMSVRSETSNMYIQEQAYSYNKSILEEYSSFLHISSPIKLLPKDTKNMIEDIIYRELVIDWEKFLEFNEYFTNWREL